MDHAFSGIHAVVMGLNNLQFAVVFDEKFLDVFRCLIIHNVQLWFISLCQKVFKVPFICLEDAHVVQSRNGCCKDGIGFVVV